MNTIFTIGIFLAFFQFVLLLNKKNKSLPDKILAIWMLIIGIHFTSYYLYYLGYWNKYPHLIGVTVPFPFLYGPFLYLYTLTSLSNNKKLNKKDYLHFLPAVLSYLYMFRFYFFYSAEEKRLVDTGAIDDFKIFSIILLVLFMISGMTYSFYSYKLITKHRQLIDNNFSNDENINLNWLKYCIWGTGLIFSTVVLVVVSRNLMGVEYPFNPDLIFYSMAIVGIFALGYFGIRHQNIFVDNTVSSITDLQSKSEYKNSGLNDEKARKGHKKLLQIMTEKKPYLEPKLTLSMLAGMLQISPNYLSQIINQFEQQNFNDFVNKYRVEEFIERANKNSNFSILANAFDSGFNSKSSFNNVFKKHKGITPSQYISKHS